jgi:hypothetical protein
MGQFNDTLNSVTGAAAQNLAALLLANGFPTGFNAEMLGTELTILAPSAQSVFWGGSSTVTDAGATKGFEIQAGSYDTQRASGNGGDVIDPSQIWLYLATTDDVGVRFRYKS